MSALKYLRWPTGVALQQVVGPPDARWMTYLIETGEIDGYEGLCKCYACQRVRDGYERWKYEKMHNPQPTWRSNDQAHPTAAGGTGGAQKG